jgi:Flp pilus assembly pilin Flp
VGVIGSLRRSRLVRDERGLQQIGAEFIGIVLVAVVFAVLFKAIPGAVSNLWSQIIQGLQNMLSQAGF